MRTEFDKYDTDKSGTIDVYELASIFFDNGLYRTKAELERLIEKWDYNGNGQIDFAEYCEIMTSRLTFTKDADCTIKAFREYDVDGDGCISESDLRQSLMKVLVAQGQEPNVQEVALIAEAMMESCRTND